MENTIRRLKKIKVDSLYGKKKHFNAADRLEKRHYQIGVPLIILNILTGSILFYVLTDDTIGWIKYVPLVLALIAALLSGFQTYFNLPKTVEGHRRVGNRYLKIMKECDRYVGYASDELIEATELVMRIEKLADEAEEVNQEAESYPTNKIDFEVAQKGLDSGEEKYTKKELKT